MRRTACTVVRSLVLGLALSMALLASGDSAARADVPWWEQSPQADPLDQRQVSPDWSSRISWKKGYIEVVARGSADPRLAQGMAHAEILALKTARMRAYERLLEVIKGIHLDSSTTLRQELLADSRLRARLQGTVRGARVIQERVTHRPDGSLMATVRLGLPLGHPKGLSGAAQPWLSKRPTPPAKRFHPRDQAYKTQALYGQRYTGLIVLAQGLGARPALFPRVVEAASRREVYGPGQINHKVALERGVVAYAASLETARRQPRAGSRPLVVRALKAQGPGRSRLVVSYPDAVKIFAADLKENFLANCGVVIVIN